MTFTDVLHHKMGHARGPAPGMGKGPGKPWAGIVEDTPAFWVTWLIDAARLVDVEPQQLQLSVAGRPVELTSVELTFGQRWYFRCPDCGRRCEALYFTRRVSCRECCHLGYRSSARRINSPWLAFERLLSDRHWHHSTRSWAPTGPAAVLVERLADEIRDSLQRQVNEVISDIKISIDKQTEEKR